MQTGNTYDIVVVLLAQYETKLRVIMIGLLEFRTEDNHHAVLEEIVELYGIRVKSLILQVVDPNDYQRERCDPLIYE
jgi:hypothetical protein